jgi:uncharacterized membrane protein
LERHSDILKAYRLLVQIRRLAQLFIIIGNYMGKLKHIISWESKHPGPLANEEVWYKTHRMADLSVFGGILFMISSLLPETYMSKIIFIVIIGLAAIPVGYSYVIYKKLEKEQ